ncbi:MAG: hypothetical protein J07HX64_01329 [halophilic archaeon J07HX64]|nr:MAG: hypothetical protein J07HX64_01329 [halophilic archaeon J07HX64]
MSPGTYEIQAHADGHQPGRDTATVTAATTTTPDIEMPVPDLPPVVGESPPLDLNGGGLHRDIYGDGQFDIFDVQALFDDLDSQVVQDNSDRFDFSGNGGPVTIFDVQALFGDLEKSEALDSE